MQDIIIWILVLAPLGWLVWRQSRITGSAAKPIVQAQARITKMMGKIGPIKLGRSSGFKNIPGYYVTFEVLSGEFEGKKRVFFIDAVDVVDVAVGYTGTLTTRGVRYISFDIG